MNPAYTTRENARCEECGSPAALRGGGLPNLCSEHTKTHNLSARSSAMKMAPDPQRFGATGKEVAPNGRRISKGMHLPVVGDVDIQWHLRTSSYDRCRACGSNDIGYIRQSMRACMACSATWELSVDIEQWWQEIGSRTRVLNRKPIITADTTLTAAKGGE